MVIDDFADDPIFMRQSKLLPSLFTRGRHNNISTTVSTQKFASIHPIVRINAVALIVYRLRNNKEVESFLEEVSGLTEQKELLAIYKAATDDEYKFLYVNLSARKVSDMFYKNFTGRIELEDEQNDWYYQPLFRERSSLRNIHQLMCLKHYDTKLRRMFQTQPVLYK